MDFICGFIKLFMGFKSQKEHEILLNQLKDPLIKNLIDDN